MSTRHRRDTWCRGGTPRAFITPVGPPVRGLPWFRPVLFIFIHVLKNNQAKVSRVAPDLHMRPFGEYSRLSRAVINTDKARKGTSNAECRSAAA